MKAPTKEEYEEAKAQLYLCKIAIGGIDNQIRELSEYRSVLANSAELCRRIINLYESNRVAGVGDKKMSSYYNKWPFCNPCGRENQRFQP